MRFDSMQLTLWFWPRLLNIWNNKSEVSFSDFWLKSIFDTRNLETFSYKLMTKSSSKVQQITTPFTSLRICDFVQEEYALMVDVDQNALFELHAVADFLGIQPLLELTSLAVLLHYMWVGVYTSDF